MTRGKISNLYSDFITCWCKYLLDGYTDSMLENLKLLAEKGEIHAIQNWYLFMYAGENIIIDNQVKNLKFNTYDDLFAKIRYEDISQSDIEKLEKISRYIDEVHIPGEEGLSHYTARAMMAREMLNDINLVKEYKILLNGIFKKAERENDYIVYEDANEIYQEYIDIILEYSEKDSKESKKHLRDMNAKIIKNLLNETKKYGFKNINVLVEKDEVLAFTFAKSILLFNAEHKYKKAAIRILEKLATRQYKEINNKDIYRRK